MIGIWTQIYNYIQKKVISCKIHQKTKRTCQNFQLYSSLHVPNRPWEDISMDFLLGLSIIQRGNDSIQVVVDIFSKMAQIIPYKKTFDDVYVAKLFFKDMVRLHGLPRTIASNRDTKFIGHF